MNDNTTALADALMAPDFWRELMPGASISEAPYDGFGFGNFSQSELVEHLGLEGYDGPFPLLAPDQAKLLRAAVDAVRALGLPPVFAFVYDEAWRAFHDAHQLVAAGMGEDFVQLPAIWGWHLDPTTEAKGFVPHRDRGHLPAPTVGRQNYLTVWLALTEATTRNGCMMVLPGQWDPGYHGKGGPAPMVGDFQNFRALPCSAGSFYVWNAHLLHWGGRASRRADGPRISIACEFIQPDLVGTGNDFELPTRSGPRVVTVDRRRLPPFDLRLAFITFAVRRYRHLEKLPIPLVELAERLHNSAVERLYDSPWGRSFASNN